MPTRESPQGASSVGPSVAPGSAVTAAAWKVLRSLQKIPGGRKRPNMIIPQTLGNPEPSSKGAMHQTVTPPLYGPVPIWSCTPVTAGIPCDCWHQSAGTPWCPSILPSPSSSHPLSTPLPPGRSKLIGCVSDGEAVFPCPLPPQHHRCSVLHGLNTHAGHVPGLAESK